MSKRRVILVLYYTRGVYPLRAAIRDHLYCWRAWSRHKVVYVNVAFGFPEALLRDQVIDAVIYHTSFCGMRWSEPVFRKFTPMVEALNDHPSLKIAMPQDEFTQADLLTEFLNACRVDYVLTCAEPSEWAAIYGGVRGERVRFKTVLTGYLDEATVARAKRYAKPLRRRSLDLSYRAWRAAYWLGEHGVHKVKVGEVFAAAAAKRGLRADVSLDDEATLLGDDWLKFLGDSRATIGVEGGASLLDRDGAIKKRVDAYLRDRPTASFEEVRDACFPGLDNRFALACISPRHLEAVATRTCQILVEGDYSGVLQPERHYIPVKRDYSDAEAALDKLADDALVEAMTDRAYRDIVEPGRYTYRGFVREIEREVIEPEPPVRVGRDRPSLRLRLAVQDWLNWRFIEAEVATLQRPQDPRPRRAARLLSGLVSLPA